MNKNVRKITDGAMMTAIVGVLLVINRYSGGFFEGTILFLFPIPMVFYSVKYGWRDSLVVFTAMALLAFILGTPQTLFYVVSESLIGLVYGSGIHDHRNTRKLVILIMVMAVIINMLSMVVFAAFFGYDLVAEAAEMKEIIGQTFAQTGNVLPSTINLEQFIWNVMIVTTALTGIMEAFVTHVLSRLLLKRMRFHVEPATPIAEYYPAKITGYFGIIGFVGYFYSLLKPLENSFWQNALQSLGMCGLMYLTVFGYIGLVVLGKTRFGNLRGIFVLIAIFCMFSAPQFLAFFGFLYITTDLHKSWVEGAKNASEIK